MYLIDRKNNRCIEISKKTFTELEFREREHLQEWLAADPGMFGENLLIIQKEFDGFADTKERLDLLALDEEGNLVIIENKLDDTGRDVTWQAMKYASYCSSLGKDEIRTIYQAYLDKKGTKESAESKLSDFFQKDYEEILLNRGTSQRIILVAAKFRKEVTSTVLWLMNFNLRIQCFKVTPYQKGEDIFLDIEQIIPIKDAEDYIIKVAIKKKEDSEIETQLATRHLLRQELWTELLKSMNAKSDLFKNISPSRDGWINSGAGISGISYSFVVTKNGARVELYLGNSSKEKNKEVFDYLFSKKEIIENEFNGSLIWTRLDDKDASRIYAGLDYNYFDKDCWPSLIESMIETMLKFHEVISTHLQKYKASSKG